MSYIVLSDDAAARLAYVLRFCRADSVVFEDHRATIRVVRERDNSAVVVELWEHDE